MRELIVVRTHVADAAALAAYDTYAKIAGVDVTFCCDERKGPVDVGDRRKVVLDQALMARLGLLAHPNAGWRCGDYHYYAARTALPEYDFYWLIEPDVLIHSDDPAGFFAAHADPAVDFLAMRFGPYGAHWMWEHTARDDYATVYGCNFPISRLSARAVDHLMQARRAASEAFAGRDMRHWPNDEVFVASELMRAGFTCRDFNAGEQKFYTPRSFRIGALHDRERLAASPPDGMIWHPVRDFDTWFKAFAPWLEGKDGKPGAADQPIPDAGAARRLANGATTLVESRALPGGALLPYLLARRALATRPWAAGMADGGAPMAGADTQSRNGVERQLATHFGPQPGKRPLLGTAHLAQLRKGVAKLSVSRPDDFELEEPMPLGVVPRRHVLPYCFDFEAREMLLTLHLQPAPLLEEPFLYAAQRSRARAVIRIPWAQLDRALGTPDRQARPILIFSIGRTGSTLLDSLLGCATPRSISEPDTATQLGQNRRDLLALGPALHDRLVAHAIAPLFTAEFGAPPEAPCAIKLRSQANGALPDLARVYPRARFIFMLRQRLPWARSTYRAFRMKPENAVGRLMEGLRNLRQLLQCGVDYQVVHYEEVVADPQATLARVLGLDLPLDPALAARIEAAMQADSQQGSAVSRERTSRAAPDEAAWMASFETEWQARAPRQLLKELQLDLG